MKKYCRMKKKKSSAGVYYQTTGRRVSPRFDISFYLSFRRRRRGFIVDRPHENGYNKNK